MKYIASCSFGKEPDSFRTFKPGYTLRHYDERFFYEDTQMSMFE